MAPSSSKEFLDIQSNYKCGFTLKLVRAMIITYRLLAHLKLKLTKQVFFKSVYRTSRDIKSNVFTQSLNMIS